MARLQDRLALVEYGARVDLINPIIHSTGFDRAKATQLLLDASQRIKSILPSVAEPISIEPGGARAQGFAGLVRLSPGCELEVAPKYLGLDDARWREDFYFLSTLSQHARVLANEDLHAGAENEQGRDLSTLVARSLTRMYEARKRRPLRSYRKVKEADFYIEDDPDPVELRFPTPDGFEQNFVRYDRRNAWNAAMQGAAKTLLTEVTDSVASAALVRMVMDLSPQQWKGSPSRRRIPSRHQAWRPLHDLSLHVLKGLGITYRPGDALAPGYVASTWEVWQDLLEVSADLAFGRALVDRQKRSEFAVISRPKVNDSIFHVIPDLVIKAEGLRPRFILDAKYKGNIANQGTFGTTDEDIYHAFAFSEAFRCNTVVLAYPARADLPARAPGDTHAFQRVKRGEVVITSVQVEVRGIGKRGALDNFATNLRNSLVAIVATESPT